MKKTVSTMLCLLLIFSSVSFAFADFTTTDSNNLTSIKNALTSGSSSIYGWINSINNRLYYNNQSIASLVYSMYTRLGDIYNALFYNSDSIAHLVYDTYDNIDSLANYGYDTMMHTLDILNQLSYFSSGGARQSYVSNIASYLNQINTKMTTLNNNVSGLSSTVTDIYTVNSNTLPGIYAYSGNIDTTTSTYLPYLNDLRTALTNEIHYDEISGLSVAWSKHFAHYNLFRSLYGSSDYDMAKGRFTLPALTQSGQKVDYGFYWNYGTPLGNVAMMIQQLLYNDAAAFTYRWSADLTGYNSTQTAKNWLTLNNKTFTPTSQTNGLYTWLANIQEPIARLSYVHASDEEIAASEKAATNQTAVVNNFIDSSGSGAAPASSFGSVASMSSGYTSNMNTDAQASGIWNIFNSNNFGWFSQETANQLDTTVSTRKGSSDFETPLLDQQIADIYKELGVDVND